MPAASYFATSARMSSAGSPSSVASAPQSTSISASGASDSADAASGRGAIGRAEQRAVAALDDARLERAGPWVQYKYAHRLVGYLFRERDGRRGRHGWAAAGCCAARGRGSRLGPDAVSAIDSWWRSYAIFAPIVATEDATEDATGRPSYRNWSAATTGSVRGSRLIWPEPGTMADPLLTRIRRGPPRPSIRVLEPLTRKNHVPRSETDLGWAIQRRISTVRLGSAAVKVARNRATPSRKVLPSGRTRTTPTTAAVQPRSRATSGGTSRTFRSRTDSIFCMSSSSDFTSTITSARSAARQPITSTEPRSPNWLNVYSTATSQPNDARRATT